MESNRPLPKGTADLTPDEYTKYVEKLVLNEMVEIKQLLAGFVHRKKDAQKISATLNEDIDNLLTGLVKKELTTFDQISAKLHSMIRYAMSHRSDSQDDPNRELIDLFVWRIDKLIDKCKDIAFYNHYGINVEPGAFKTSPEVNFDFSKGLPDHVFTAMQADPQLCLVYVTGAEAEIAGKKYQVNPYGHALIFLGVAGFIHIDGTNNPPKHMTIPQFNKYLNDNKKSVLGMQTIDLLSINDTLLAIKKAASTNFLWGAVIHNCIDFCFEMFEAGGFKTRRVEYEKLFWSLPTNYLAQTPEHELKPGRRLHSDHRPSFDPQKMEFNYMDTSYDTKGPGNILDVKYVVKNYTPDDMIKYVNHIYKNLEKIIMDISLLRTNQKAEADKTKSTKKGEATDKTKLAKNESSFYLAVDEIRAALNTMREMIQTIYKPLFDDRRYSIINELLNTGTIDLKLNAVAASLAAPPKLSESDKDAQFLAAARAQHSVFTRSAQSSSVSQDDTPDKKATKSAAPSGGVKK